MRPISPLPEQELLVGNPVVFFEIMAKDAPALRSFYKNAFDWQFDAPVEGAKTVDYTIVHPNGESSELQGGIGAAPEGYAGHVTFYVGVPDAESALRKVESLGGKRMMGPEQVPNGPIIALFNDPQGYTVGLVQTQD